MNNADWTDFTQGALRFETAEAGMLQPVRHTRRQLEIYSADSEGRRIRAMASAGVCLECETDARALTLEGAAAPGSSQDIWAFDLFVDGRLYAHREGSIEREPRIAWTQPLPEGRKRLKLYFPTLSQTCVKTLTLEEASCIESVERRRKLLCLGDSITQGFITRFPSAAYANVLARELDMEMLNQGVGGVMFDPAVVDGETDYEPDVITVAYGTNDWVRKTMEAFSEDAAACLKALRAVWPKARMAVVSPLWRRDIAREDVRYAFGESEGVLRRLAEENNALFIPGGALLPEVPELMGDHVHPNDLGHLMIGRRLAERLKAVE